MLLTTQQDACDQADSPMPDLELRAYAYAFREWLESAETFRAFKLYVTKELQRLGFSDWSYERLDIPLAARIPVGTFQREYYAHTLGPDLMHEHVTTRTGKSPVFRSTIEEFLQQSPIEVDTLLRAEALYEHYEQLGYYDCVGIPVYSGKQGSHALFTVTAKTKESDYIKQTFSSCKDKLHIIIEIIEDVGNDNYPECFIGLKQKYEKLAQSGPLKLLVAMVEHDCGIEHAANTVGISRTAADKQLARIRERLNVRTTHAAVLKAIKLGLVSCDILAD